MANEKPPVDQPPEQPVSPEQPSPSSETRRAVGECLTAADDAARYERPIFPWDEGTDGPLRPWHFYSLAKGLRTMAAQTNHLADDATYQGLDLLPSDPSSPLKAPGPNAGKEKK